MYIPQHFAEKRPEVLARAIREIQFALLVTAVEGKYFASHVYRERLMWADPGSAPRTIPLAVSRESRRCPRRVCGIVRCGIALLTPRA